MTTHSYTPSVGEVGGAPSGWATAGGNGGISYTVVDAGSGRYAIRFSGGTVNTSSVALQWTSNGNPAPFADGEIYVRFRHRGAGVNPAIGAYLRASGANPSYEAGGFSAYWVRARLVGTDLGGMHREYNDGVGPVFESDFVSLSAASNVDLHLVLKTVGNNIQFKLWKEGDPEPEFTTRTDPTVTASASPRIFALNEADTDVYFVGVGTGGDAAPRGGGPVATGPTLSLPTKSDTSTTATGGFTTSGADGTARMVWTRSATPPSAAQVKAGQNHLGSTTDVVAPAALTITSSGAKSFAAATVTTALTWWGYVVHTNAAAADSAVLALGPVYPGTGRPVADVSVSGWAPSTGSTVFGVLDEDAPGSDADFVTSPTLSGAPSTASMTLDKTYPAGTYSIKVRASVDTGAGTVRVRLLNGSDVSQGVTADQAISTTPMTYTLPITISGDATRIRVEVVAA